MLLDEEIIEKQIAPMVNKIRNCLFSEVTKDENGGKMYKDYTNIFPLVRDVYNANVEEQNDNTIRYRFYSIRKGYAIFDLTFYTYDGDNIVMQIFNGMKRVNILCIPYYLYNDIGVRGYDGMTKIIAKIVDAINNR